MYRGTGRLCRPAEHDARTRAEIDHTAILHGVEKSSEVRHEGAAPERTPEGTTSRIPREVGMKLTGLLVHTPRPFLMSVMLVASPGSMLNRQC